MQMQRIVIETLERQFVLKIEILKTDFYGYNYKEMEKKKITKFSNYCKLKIT